MTVQRPSWLPSFIPELDGLRGLAMLGVVLFHNSNRLKGTWFDLPARWGWSGVLLFFAMSGFLITAGLLESRDRPDYFHNFHRKRVLRIAPLYAATVIVCYALAPWLIGPPESWGVILTAPWLAYLFFVQNLLHTALPPALAPTWALAIEEQYYFLWAPIVRWLRRPWMLGLALLAALALSPLCRYLHPHWLTPTHSLIKLDALALGSLMALLLYTLRVGKGFWALTGFGMAVLGMWAARGFAGGTYLLDTALAVLFTGLTAAAIGSTGARTWANRILSKGPLAFYGRISYSVFLTHIAVFIFFGWFDLWIDKLSGGQALWGNLLIVVFHLTTSTAVGWAIFRWFETPILKRKKRLSARPA